MLNSIDLRTLRAFVAVAREGNVTRAAEQLRITQPAVTLQLKRLASETGVALFRRVSTGLSLTQEGALLAAKAEQVLAALTAFDQTAGRLGSRAQGTLRIGTIIAIDTNSTSQTGCSAKRSSTVTRTTRPTEMQVPRITAQNTSLTGKSITWKVPNGPDTAAINVAAHHE